MGRRRVRDKSRGQVLTPFCVVCRGSLFIALRDGRRPAAYGVVLLAGTKLFVRAAPLFHDMMHGQRAHTPFTGMRLVFRGGEYMPPAIV